MSAGSEPNPQQPPRNRSRASFLLRCIKVKDTAGENSFVWRFSVKQIDENAQEQHFSSSGQLLDFIVAVLEKESEGTHHVRFTPSQNENPEP